MTGEFDWIRELAERFGSGWASDGILGIGDDAAVLPFPADDPDSGGGDALVLSVDSQVIDAHYHRGWLSWSELGYRLIQIGFSDIAAMGARSYAVLVSVEVGPEISPDDRRAFTDGLEESARSVGARLVGGNIAGRSEGFSAHVTAIGRQKRGQLLLRRGALPGDDIYVTGHLGSARAAIEILSSEAVPRQQDETALIGAYRCPRAHLGEGLILAETGWATSAIDISDGLGADLTHICEASEVGAAIEADLLPITPELTAWCSRSKTDPVPYALDGGEDYVLLFTARSDDSLREAATAHIEQQGGQIWRIGRVGEARSIVVRRDGRDEPLDPSGFDHLRPN